MCGIVGHLSRDGSPVDIAAFSAALTSLRHRGPDDEGYVAISTGSGRATPHGGPDTPAQVRRLGAPYAPSPGPADACDLALAARRLAIQDLSPAGHQPLCNEDGSVWVVHNGEIHNFVELRRELEARGHALPLAHGHRSRSCTRTRSGARSCFHRFNGMWALALWDAQAQAPRLQPRPLRDQAARLHARPAGALRVRLGDQGAARARRGRAGGERRHRLRLPRARLRRPQRGDVLPRRPLAAARPSAAHHARKRVGRGAVVRRAASDTRALQMRSERFAELFTDATSLRLVSDVPVGTCLSGGLDSSAIACTVAELMRGGATLGGASVQKTFSARYPEDPSVDEGRVHRRSRARERRGAARRRPVRRRARRRPRPAAVAPGGAVRQHEHLRAVVRVPPRARGGRDGDARRAGRRRGRRRLSPAALAVPDAAHPERARARLGEGDARVRRRRLDRRAREDGAARAGYGRCPAPCSDRCSRRRRCAAIPTG